MDHLINVQETLAGSLSAILDGLHGKRLIFKYAVLHPIRGSARRYAILPMVSGQPQARQYFGVVFPAISQDHGNTLYSNIVQMHMADMLRILSGLELLGSIIGRDDEIKIYEIQPSAIQGYAIFIDGSQDLVALLVTDQEFLINSFQ